MTLKTNANRGGSLAAAQRAERIAALRTQGLSFAVIAQRVGMSQAQVGKAYRKWLEVVAGQPLAKAA